MGGREGFQDGFYLEVPSKCIHATIKKFDFLWTQKGNIPWATEERTVQDKTHGAAKMNFSFNLNNCCQSTFCSNCPAPSRAWQTTAIKGISNAPAGDTIKCFLPFWQTVCHYSSSPTVTLPCHGCNSWAFQKPVVDLHTEIIDLCNTSPSLFVIYIFPYDLNTVIVPLSVLVLLLLYTGPLGLTGEISMTEF